MTETETREIEITKEDSKQTDLAKKNSISNLINPFFNRISPWFDEYWWPFTNRIRFPFSIKQSKFRIPLTTITVDDSMYYIEAEIPGFGKKGH